MRYYKNSDNKVFAFNDDDIPSDWVNDELIEISEQNADELISPSKEEIIANSESHKILLISEASESIAPLQDAVDLEMATSKEISALNVWKNYRVDLNRVDTALAPDIDWPVKPE